MFDVAYLSGLGIPATAALLPLGQWVTAVGVSVLGLLFAGLLVYLYLRERVRGRRLEVMNAIASIAVGAGDQSRVMLTAMNELCHLYRAKFAWFQTVEGEELVLTQQVGLPEWLAESRRRVPVRSSAIMPLLDGRQARKVGVRSLAPELRDELERAGMRSLLVVPVAGERGLVGILVFGLTGRRSCTAEQLRFLTTTGNQLGVAAENLRLFEQVLQAKRQWLATIDSICDSILVHDAESRVLRMNRTLARRLGRPLPELTGQPLASVLPNAQLGCPYCELAKQRSGEVADPCFGGYALISTSSYYVENDRVGTVHVICDRTERRLGEERYRLLVRVGAGGRVRVHPRGAAD